HGINGTGQIVGLADSGLDLSSCYFDQDCDSPVDTVNMECQKVIAYTCYVDCVEHKDPLKSHGTHVSGTIIGHAHQGAAFVEDAKYNGIAKGARLAFFDMGEESENSTVLTAPSDFNSDLLEVCY
ncbi:unnamed protein product, partial [Discosporangium mesarthrocarpum]